MHSEASVFGKWFFESVEDIRTNLGQSILIWGSSGKFSKGSYVNIFSFGVRARGEQSKIYFPRGNQNIHQYTLVFCTLATRVSVRLKKTEDTFPYCNKQISNNNTKTRNWSNIRTYMHTYVHIFIYSKTKI